MVAIRRLTASAGRSTGSLRASDLEGANFKRRRKTSPSLMMGSKYSGLRTLFLGHVPREIADIHDTDPTEDTLDEAIVWLVISEPIYEPDIVQEIGCR